MIIEVIVTGRNEWKRKGREGRGERSNAEEERREERSSPDWEKKAAVERRRRGEERNEEESIMSDPHTKYPRNTTVHLPSTNNLLIVRNDLQTSVNYDPSLIKGSCRKIWEKKKKN